MHRPSSRVGEGRLSHHHHHHQVLNNAADESTLGLKSETYTHARRPMSVATEFVDTDWDEEIVSDVEDNSPRVSLQSLGHPSITTVSSYDEVPTPRSSGGREVFVDAFADACPKQVQGPRGPHLFRSSADQALLGEDTILTLSPLVPRPSCEPAGNDASATRFQTPPRQGVPRFQYTHRKLDASSLASWTPEMVAQFMLDAGIDVSVADRFIANDINGEIVATLKFEDLRELDITSFGIRTRVWHQIQALRDSRPSSPRPATPIEDAPSREARKEARHAAAAAAAGSRADGSPAQRRQSSSRRRSRTRRRPSGADGDDVGGGVVSPLDSVSIIGIEQLVPRPHHCSKGEKCSKWRRQQRAMDDFRRAHPHVDVSAAAGSAVLIFGDAGIPAAADPGGGDVAAAAAPRPMSDAVQSVAASSDVFGPAGPPPLLQEAALSGVQCRDAQDNVRQFLSFQHQSLQHQGLQYQSFQHQGLQHQHQSLQHQSLQQQSFQQQSFQQKHQLHQAEAAAGGAGVADEVPPTPPFELAPAVGAANASSSPSSLHSGLRRLPKLSIPGMSAPLRRPSLAQLFGPAPAPPPPLQQQQHPDPPAGVGPVPAAAPPSPDLLPGRLASPLSELDVPVVAAGPVARKGSQSVPPDLGYHHHHQAQQQQPQARPSPPRSQSRVSVRRPSFSVLPALHEHKPAYTAGRAPSPKTAAGRGAGAGPQQPVQAPPRFNYPWSPSPSSEGTASEQTVPPAASSSHGSGSSSGSSSGSRARSGHLQEGRADPPGGGIAFQGPMRKRKMRLFRHEWQNAYFTIRGTRLNMHRDAGEVDRTLEYIDIDDYAIACSNLASSSKLSAAFKAMHLSSHSRGKSDPVSAFSFQLVPQDSRDRDGGAARFRRRDSSAAQQQQQQQQQQHQQQGGAQDRRGGQRQAAAAEAAPAEAVNGTGKTHHFAVRSRDERIDWMRELMLAKALKQKGDGFEISVNGNMI